MYDTKDQKRPLLFDKVEASEEEYTPLDGYRISNDDRRSFGGPIERSNRGRFVLFAVFLVTIVFIITALKASHARDISSRRYLFTFGDSYTSTSFTVNGLLPSPENPFGNPPYPGQTTVSGPNWVGNLIHDLSPPATLSYNFAFGGSVIDSAFIPSAKSLYNFVNATEVFVSLFNPQKVNIPWTGTNSAFMYWFGINDILRTFDVRDETMESLFEKIIGSYYRQAGRAYALGGRRFIFMGMHNAERTPYFQTYRNAADRDLVKENVAIWNRLIIQGAAKFQMGHPDAKVEVLETAPVLDNLLNSPEENGAPDSICFNKDAVSCLWWDPLHPGKLMHRDLAIAAYDSLKRVGFYS